MGLPKVLITVEDTPVIVYDNLWGQSHDLKTQLERKIGLINVAIIGVGAIAPTHIEVFALCRCRIVARATFTRKGGGRR